jgi:ubiquinone/menaquinone biosynthesis C-methylase UbiE
VTASSDEANNRLLGERKRALFAGLAGDVLEIGPGTGANLPFLPAGVRWVGVEPNPYMRRYLRRKAEQLGLAADLRAGSAERLDVPDGSVDTVICTLVLCSVHDVAGALREVQRVLRPGGRFVFIEHVAAPAGTRLRTVQRLVRPLWRFIADGCTPDRETWVALERAGFASVRYQRFRMDVPLPFVSPAIAGTATSAARSS